MSESFRDNSNEANGYSGKSMTWQRFHRLAWRNISHCPFMISVGLVSSSPACQGGKRYQIVSVRIGKPHGYHKCKQFLRYGERARQHQQKRHGDGHHALLHVGLPHLAQ
jgi:hypothetical protein